MEKNFSPDKNAPSHHPALESLGEDQASPEEAPPEGPEVLAEEPFRIEWWPANRSLMVEAGAGITPWEFVFPDRVTAHLPLQGHYRIYFVGGDGRWETDSDVFWERAEVCPTGALLPEPGLWQELDPAGVWKTRDDPPEVKL